MIKALVAQSVKARLAGGLTDIDDELRPMTHSQPIFAAKNQSSDVAGRCKSWTSPIWRTREKRRGNILSQKRNSSVQRWRWWSIAESRSCK